MTAVYGIDETKGKLQNEISLIGALKVATEQTNTFISIDYVTELRSTLIESAENLIKNCEDYAARYKRLFGIDYLEFNEIANLGILCC